MNDENQSDQQSNQANSQPPEQLPIVPSQNQGVLSQAESQSARAELQEAEKLVRDTRMIEWLQLGANVILAVVGIFAVCIYGGQLEVYRGQLGEMIKQYPELKKSAQGAADSAKAASDAVAQAERNAHLDQRAWVGVEAPHTLKVGSGFAIIGKIRNTGKTPAFNIRKFTPNAVSECCYLESLIGPLDPHNLSESGTLPPAGEMPFSVGFFENPSTQPGTLIMVRGLITYNDAFAREHFTNFCFASRDNKDFTFCPCCNDTDDYPEKWPKSRKKSFKF